MEEVVSFEGTIPPEKVDELKAKASNLIDAVCQKRLIVHDPGTFAMLFIIGPSPIYLNDFFQYKSAIKMLLSFLETEECYFEVIDNRLAEMVEYVTLLKVNLRKSYEVFDYFFKQDQEEQERILFTIKNLRWMYSREGILKQIGGLFESVEEELSYISNLLQDLKSDANFVLFFGKERDNFEAEINQLLAEKSAEKALLSIQGKIKENYDEVNSYPDIFKPNGFRLFNYLMKNHLTSGKGWQSDVSFFYRVMEERDQLIHAKQKRFKEFLADEYPYLEPMGKFKVWNDINTEKRRQAYLSAKSAIGLK
ncbi:MAG: hypothetical protein ACQEW9_07020 [Bacteroidota bacterium]